MFTRRPTTSDLYLMLLSVGRQLGRISFKLDLDLERDLIMSKEIDDLEAEVADTGNHIASAVTLIEGIAARIEAAGVDKAKLSALTAELNAKSDQLAAAVSANTPAADLPPVPIPEV